MQLNDLQQRIALVRGAIERNAEASRALVAGRTSRFWAEIFAQRRIYPDINALMVCRREGNIVGVGDDPQGTLDREREYCARVHHIFHQMTPAGFAKSLPESSFGSPLVFEHDGVERSANFWINSVTTSRVVDFVRGFGKSGPLRVLEIGPGWGMCVYQLHHLLDVESYTLIDLPENLYISTLHLGTVLPERPIEFIDVLGPKISRLPAGKICAGLPGAIDRLSTEFDLIINSFSLQEMDLESVQSYIAFIEKALSKDGIFVSLNSHGKAGVAVPGDYGYRRFHIHNWKVFRKVPAGFYNTIPYEVVVGRRKSDSPDYPIECQNGLGWLMQVGLDKNVEHLAEALVRGELTSNQREFLRLYDEFFSCRADDERFRKLDQLKALDASPALPFLTGLLQLARGDIRDAAASLNNAIGLGLQGFALIKARVFLAGLAVEQRTAYRLEGNDGIVPAFAYPEVREIIEDGQFDRAVIHINRTFGRDGG